MYFDLCNKGQLSVLHSTFSQISNCLIIALFHSQSAERVCMGVQQNRRAVSLWLWSYSSNSRIKYLSFLKVITWFIGKLVETALGWLCSKSGLEEWLLAMTFDFLVSKWIAVPVSMQIKCLNIFF